jgi:Raf kinase inhibitor-like YbhB/YbcL family protein
MTSPYDSIGAVATFTVTSEDIADGERLSRAQVSGIMGAGGDDLSPQLSWQGNPPETKSFAVTMYDPDAPTASGFWHWAVCNIGPDVTSLRTGAGSGDSAELPDGALTVPSETRLARYIGAAPPPGHGPHRYYLAVHALDVEKLDIAPESTPAVMCFNMFGHTLARAELQAWYEVAAEEE